MQQTILGTAVAGLLLAGPWNAGSATLDSAVGLRTFEAASEFPMSFQGSPDCGACMNCESPSSHWFLWGDGPHRAHGETTHGCSVALSDGSCADRHPTSIHCPTESPDSAMLDQDAREELWASVITATEDDVLAIIDRFGGTVTYHATRRAIQVHGCDGGVTLSVPLGFLVDRTVAVEAF